MAALITLKDISKVYEETVALDGINIQFEHGKVYGLIGRNGAGKTTMLKIIAKQLFQSGGGLEFDHNIIERDEDVVLARDFCSYLSNYKIKDLLAIARKLYPKWNHVLEKEILDQFELETKKTYIKASKGMQTMVSLIIALCSDAKVLLLDEPYAGLDPINRETFYRLLRNHYFNEDKTVIISSHIIKEIEGYFENAIILNKGKVLVDEVVEDIRSKSFVVEGPKDLYEAIKSTVNVLGCDKIGHHHRIFIYDQLSIRTREEIDKYGGSISTMDLQDLMVQMCLTRRD